MDVVGKVRKLVTRGRLRHKNHRDQNFAVTAAMVTSFHVFICISAVHNSPHSMFHTFHGLMNSTNWSDLSVRVLIAQLVEYCSENEKATGTGFSFFVSGLLPNCLNCDCNYDGHIFISLISFRLNLPGELIEDGRESASYDIDKGLIDPCL